MNAWKIQRLLEANKRVETSNNEDTTMWEFVFDRLRDVAPSEIAYEISCFVVNESGDLIPHTPTEYKDYFMKVSKKLYNLLINEEYEYQQNKKTKQIKNIEVTSMRIKFIDGNITDKNIDGATIVTDSNFVMIEKDNERTYYPLCNIRAIKVSEPKRGEL